MKIIKLLESLMSEEKFTTKQAAEFLGVSTSTIYRMEKQNLIESIRTPEGQRRFLNGNLAHNIKSASLKG
jgi:excisionase family DNA binding protein